MDEEKKKAPRMSRKKRIRLDEGQTSVSANSQNHTENVQSSGHSKSTSKEKTSKGRKAQHQSAFSRIPTTVDQAVQPSQSDNSRASNATETETNLPSSSSATDGGSPSSRPGAASPDPNCAICLGKLENKSFTDSCYHMFCFVCLLEWSKVKAECPLCKQKFSSIVHNVKSYDNFEQYHLPRREEQTQPGLQHMWDLLPGVRFRYR